MVNHQTLAGAADAIEQCIREHNDFIGQADSHVSSMANNCSDMDRAQYIVKWEKVTKSGSASKTITTQLKGYSDYFRYAAEQYKVAQSNAVNNVIKIPIW